MKIQTDAVDAPDDETSSSEAGEETPSEQGEPKPSAAEPTERERELERRLTEMGRRNATLEQTTNALLNESRELKATVTQIAATQTQDAQEKAARREAERKAYIESLPPERRTGEEVRLLREEIGELKRTRTDVPPARAASAAPAQTETDEQYAARRAREIVVETNQEFDTQLTPEDLSTLPQRAWDSEDSFYREVNKLAARKVAQGGTEMPKKDQPPKQETPAEMEERITRSVKASLGVDSPTAPRGSVPRGKRPTEADVSAAVGTYNSAAGPKGNIKKLKEIRERMG